MEAGIAQLVEQLIRNQQVAGSSPAAGSNNFNKLSCLGYPSFGSQMINTLVNFVDIRRRCRYLLCMLLFNGN